MTTILTIASLLRSIQKNSPKVSYMTAMDVYTQTSVLVVFFSLLESVTVCYLYKRKSHAWEVVEVRPSRDRRTNALPDSVQRSEMKPLNKISTAIDQMWRVVFPASCLMFNAAYWAYGLSVSAIHNDHSWVRNLNAKSYFKGEDRSG